jgi:hypothetical protein
MIADRRKIKISYDGKSASYTARVTDAETDEMIHYVTGIDFHLDPTHAPTATLHIALPVVDVVVDAEVHTHCPLCKQEVPTVKMQRWRRYRFSTGSIDDPRPVIFNARYPWWHTGSGQGFDTIVAFLPKGEDLYEYWPDAFDINSTLEDKIWFNDRFPKPDYFVEEYTL